MNQPLRHAELVAAKRNIALASDKLHALQREAGRLRPLIADGAVPMDDAVDALIDAARAHGLCSTPESNEEIENIVREGLDSRAMLVPPVPVVQAWPAMAPDAYHGVAGDVVRTIEPHTESDPAALLIQFLVAAGNAIGRGPFYQIEGDRHFTKLNVILVGATSGGRKGTSLSRVLQVMELADRDWAEYRVQSGLASGEGLIHHVRDPVFKLKDGQMEEVDRGCRISDF